MAETAIGWTHRRDPKTGDWHKGFSHNFWIGCTPVGPECLKCYAWAQDRDRFHWTAEGWGKGKPRRLKAESTWCEPLKWDKKAAKLGFPLAVFSNSLADFFDEEVSDEWRLAALHMIKKTPNLDWLVLTKRARKMRDFMTAYYRDTRTGPLPNLHLYVSAGLNSTLIERAPLLEETPAAVRGLSCEPLLEDLPDLGRILARGYIDHVIVGGESENSLPTPCRPMAPDWATSIRTTCAAHRVPFYFKQWGEYCPAYELDHNPQAQAMCVMGKVQSHYFPTGEEGRRFVYKLGKHITGRTIDGKIHDGQPPLRKLRLDTKPDQAALFKT